jgi:anti-sigma factor RsiW
VGYVYDEGERAEREAAVAHLAMCPACAAEGKEILEAIRKEQVISDATEEKLKSFLDGFTKTFAA